MAKKIKLKVQGLTGSQVQSGAYALILSEVDGPHRIPIIVGMAEAQSIAMALEHLTPPRPLTHDLFVTFTHSFGKKYISINSWMACFMPNWFCLMANVRYG